MKTNKLNFTVCYDLPQGKQFSMVASVWASNNLIDLNEKMRTDFIFDGEHHWIKPVIIMFQPSRKQAHATADAWNATAKADNRLWDFSGAAA